MVYDALLERTNTMATGDRKDPFLGYNFKLEIDGLIMARFREASGLGKEEATEKESKTANSSQKIPGVNTVGHISLKWGNAIDARLWNWHTSVAQGKTERKNGSIVLSDESGEERWNFVNGFPTKWTGPAFNADTNDLAIETLEIAHEGLTKA
jgi:phage tail-like protein